MMGLRISRPRRVATPRQVAARRRVAASLCVAATMLAAACADDDTTAPATTDTQATNRPVTLTLLAHDSFTPSEGILDEFTAESGVRVEVVRSGDAGTLVTKAILAAGNPEADVLWGVDNTLLSRALGADVFVPHLSVHRADLDAAAVALAPNGEVTPVDTGDVCINYDREWFAKRNLAPPLTLQALTSANYRNLLVVPNPVSSSPGLAFLLATIAEFGDGWVDWWKVLRDNGVLVVESWSDAYYGHFTAASDGTRPLVVSYATSPPAEVIFADPRPTQAPTAVAALTCFRQYEFVGILRGTSNEAAARSLVDFLVSRRFQEDLPLTQFVWPINKTATLPREFSDFALRPENPLTIDPATIAAKRAEWLDAFSDVMLR
jgi:thiamine transport system substrate-binding protein